MKKNFKFYVPIWAIMLVAFNVVAFLVCPIIPGYVINYDTRFWIAWVFILVSFIGNLVCAYFAFKAENLKKMFYNLPLITVSWSALIAMLVVSCALMLIPNCPAWIATIVCILILTFNAIAVIKAVWAADTVSKIHEKVKVKTSFIKNLTVDADSILARAKSDAVKAECKKVYEAVRYSDPMSNEEFSVIEAKITVKMDEISTAVDIDDVDKVKDITNELLIILKDRNNLCRRRKENEI